MFPGHLEVGNRETDLIAAPHRPKFVRFGSEEQWIPPPPTDGQQAKRYSINEYYAQDRSFRVRCLWILEGMLFVSLFLFCLLSFALQPSLIYLLDARNQLTTILSKNSSTLIDTFDVLVPPLYLSSICYYCLLGILPLGLIVSAWNIGFRVSKDVVNRNCVIHGFILFFCFSSLCSTLYLNMAINKFDRMNWMFDTQKVLEEAMEHPETLLGKLETEFSCCGFRAPMDYWYTKNHEFRLGSDWFNKCTSKLENKLQYCRLPSTCSAAFPREQDRIRTMNSLGKNRTKLHKFNQAWYQKLKKKIDLGCDHKIRVSWFPYFLISYIFLGISLASSIFIIVILLWFPSEKAENQKLHKIHRSSENKLQFEILRLERKAKDLPAKEKELYLTPFVYTKDIPNHSQSVSVEVAPPPPPTMKNG